jgi:hypothetical protein
VRAHLAAPGLPRYERKVKRAKAAAGRSRDRFIPAPAGNGVSAGCNVTQAAD